jgi:hypothetical protein
MFCKGFKIAASRAIRQYHVILGTTPLLKVCPILVPFLSLVLVHMVVLPFFG